MPTAFENAVRTVSMLGFVIFPLVGIVATVVRIRADRLAAKIRAYR